ncbi:MAG: hypothetical protein ABGZ53_09315, partial [Fuerstiella sp.]
QPVCCKKGVIAGNPLFSTREIRAGFWLHRIRAVVRTHPAVEVYEEVWANPESRRSALQPLLEWP